MSQELDSSCSQIFKRKSPEVFDTRLNQYHVSTSCLPFRLFLELSLERALFFAFVGHGKEYGLKSHDENLP